MLSLIVPVYRNEGSIPELLQSLEGLSQSLDGNMEAVLVVDGSPDRCYDLLREALPQCRFRSQLILLSRNFGSFSAIRVGLQAGVGRHFAVMAADLQEPPDMVLRMHQRLAADEADVVVGVRETRDDPWHQRWPAQIFWALYRRYVVTEMPSGGVDVFGCNRAFRDALLQLEERHSSLVAQIFWLGYRRAQVGYQRLPRRHGRSAWTFGRKLSYLSDSLFAFSDLPIKLLMRGGALGVVFSCLVGAVVAVARLMGAIAVPGYTMIMLTIVFLGALNMLGLGIVGSYAWRAYENTKQRPLAVVLRAQSFPPASVALP